MLKWGLKSLFTDKTKYKKRLINGFKVGHDKGLIWIKINQDGKREYPDISFQNKGKKTQSKKKYVFT